MGDICINTNNVKNGFWPMVRGLDRNQDGEACLSENPNIGSADFFALATIVLNESEAMPAPRQAEAGKLAPPEMVLVTGKSFKIMKGEVTVGLFKQVMQGYDISGLGAEELKAYLATAKDDDSVTFVSLYDAREFAIRLTNLTGRGFRVPLAAERRAAEQIIGSQATDQGSDWTDTLRGAWDRTYSLYSPNTPAGRMSASATANNRSATTRIRLVEDTLM